MGTECQEDQKRKAQKGNLNAILSYTLFNRNIKNHEHFIEGHSTDNNYV